MRVLPMVALALATSLLAGCPDPPHPTHPLQVGCFYDVETQYNARIDHSFQDPTSNNDLCLNALPEFWTEAGINHSDICMAAMTTPDQAQAACNSYLDSTGVTVGAHVPGLLPVFGPPSGGRICGVADVIDSVVVGRGRAPGMAPNGCTDHTTLPLR